MAKNELKIPVAIGYCKNCFDDRRHGSAYCGCCQDKPERMKVYFDTQKNFPLYEKAEKKFPEISVYTIFTYGDTIYFNHFIYDIPYDLIAHELTHVFQQTKMGVKKWWDKYLKDDEFRLEQELEAYRRQYQVMKKNDLVKAAFLLDSMSDDLSSKLYGEIVSFEKAKELIKQND